MIKSEAEDRLKQKFRKGFSLQGHTRRERTHRKRQRYCSYISIIAIKVVCTLDFTVFSKSLQVLLLILPPEHLPAILGSFIMHLHAGFSAVTLIAAAHMQPAFLCIKCLEGLFIYLFMCFDTSGSPISYQ